MKKLVVLPLLAALFACGTKDLKEQSKEAISKYVASQIGAENIDLNVYKVDTLTEKTKYEIAVNDVYDKYYKLDAHLLDIAKNKLERTTGYYNQYPSQFKEQYNQALAEYNTEKEKTLKVLSKVEEFEKKSKSADSVSLVAYGVYAIAKYTTHDNVAKSDSIKIILNKDFKVIEKKDFIKQ